jgi:hypothetical protein
MELGRPSDTQFGKARGSLRPLTDTIHYLAATTITASHAYPTVELTGPSTRIKG